MKKKIAAVSVFALLPFVFSFSGCKDKTDKNGFYSQSTLNDLGIPDLPKLRDGTGIEYGKFGWRTTKEGYYTYLGSVYEYLVSLQYSFLGYPGKKLYSFFGGAPTYEAFRGNELSDYKTDPNSDEGRRYGDYGYYFIWGNAETGEKIYNNYLILSYFDPRETESDSASDEGYAYIKLPYALMDNSFLITEKEVDTEE